jgi:hypothetical protein
MIQTLYAHMNKQQQQQKSSLGDSTGQARWEAKKKQLLLKLKVL